MATVFSNKFGDDLESISEIENKFNLIKQLGITLEGLHFHCGSGVNGSSNFEKAIKLA